MSIWLVQRLLSLILQNLGFMYNLRWKRHQFIFAWTALVTLILLEVIRAVLHIHWEGKGNRIPLRFVTESALHIGLSLEWLPLVYALARKPRSWYHAIQHVFLLIQISESILGFLLIGNSNLHWRRILLLPEIRVGLLSYLYSARILLRPSLESFIHILIESWLVLHTLLEIRLALLVNLNGSHSCRRLHHILYCSCLKWSSCLCGAFILEIDQGWLDFLLR